MRHSDNIIHSWNFKPYDNRTNTSTAYAETFSMSVSTGANTLPPKAISAETFASLRSMSPMGKLAIPSISLTLVTQCPNSHMIGKWTTSPSMRKIGRNGYHPKKMMMRKNKTPKTKNPRCLHIIIYVRILDFCMFATD